MTGILSVEMDVVPYVKLKMDGLALVETLQTQMSVLKNVDLVSITDLKTAMMEIQYLVKDAHLHVKWKRVGLVQVAMP